MTRPKFRWRLEIIIGIAATITSACALMVSIMQARYSYQQQEAMVFPYLSCAFKTEFGNVEQFISNDGLGPAFISKVEMTIGDTTYSDISEPYRIFNDTFKMQGKPHISKNDLIPGWVLKAGDSRTMWSIKFPAPIDTAKVIKYYDVFNRKLDNSKQVIKIYYVDIYGNCYLFDSSKNLVERLSDCPNKVLKR